jgi:hypothetical protein
MDVIRFIARITRSLHRRVAYFKSTLLVKWKLMARSGFRSQGKRAVYFFLAVSSAAALGLVGLM